MANPLRSGARSVAVQTELQPSSLGAFVRYFLYLGTVGFGGPIALAGYMRRDLVEERRWISDGDYKEGLAFAQLAPGPLAAQLAMYLGWVRARTLGASLVGVAFVLPSFLMVLMLSALYVRFQGLSFIQGAFYGVGAAVIAIIALSAYKLIRKTVGTDRLLWLLFGVSALVTAWTESEVVWVFVASGVVAMLAKAPPRSRERGGERRAFAVLPLVHLPGWLVSGLAGPAAAGVLGTILWYFTTAALFVFGSGLAVVPFLHGGVVQRFHWLTERQFLDAVAVSMITPGPVVITVAFIGYLVAGIAGAVLAAIGIFVPVYLAVVLAAPYFHRFAANRSVKAFVDGVTAAAAGAIAGAAFVLGRRAIVDVPTVLIALATLALLVMPKRLPDPVLILLAGVVGVLIAAR
jgi:chromate transporter